MFERISKPTRIYQEAAEKIEDAIISGKLKPGDRLPSERDLAQTLGVSQRTLREAMRIVEEKGLIETNQAGNVVKDLNTATISKNLSLLIKLKKVTWENMLQFRLQLDPLVIGAAARSMTPSDLRSIREMVDSGRERYERGELGWTEFLFLDEQIHLFIAKKAGNPLYEWVFRTLLENFTQLYDLFMVNQNRFIAENIRSFETMLEAFGDRDLPAAREAARRHVLVGLKHLEGIEISGLDLEIGSSRKTEKPD